jgi:hypothetical protein
MLKYAFGALLCVVNTEDVTRNHSPTLPTTRTQTHQADQVVVSY